ncbi:DNA-binding response regulator, NarL/FixJ family, contains REC and HTH domains [Actinacidiphila yanglinensis]|uniref:DNA-binding response regulator, NarL/FixJ family, contains REC and HTH domains n=1 Tax=Actinacidiphila yanglinensis TaxID=310779 RepID=A0A1H6E4U5_9ACTN|nr:response regulator transcription factor [Actinacidiphila yanglinensis]SEG92311.1 DNA-binding response regulator, NarL/FixJ family, contains REC and HTH domains [Actinacidiphila yanglinensis]
MTIRVLVADDQAVVRDGVVLLLTSAGDIEVVGQAGDGREALRLATETRPDVALVDLRMPELDGAQVTAGILSADLGTRVLILTTYADDDAVLPALRAGAAGYLTKDATGEAVLTAVRDVAAGRTVLDPAVQRRLVQLLVDEPATTASQAPRGPAGAATTPAPVAVPASPREGAREGGDAVPPEAEGLTRREVDVVRLVAKGLNNRQVAREMVVSQATVKTHLNHVLSKLALEDRGALIAWAWRNGLATTDQ